MINFIVNAYSGKGRGRAVLKKIIDYCYDNKVEYTVHLTSAKGHATRIARALCDNDARTIVAVGGDGTFHEVLNGITSFETTAVGFIPSGRGNDFCKGAGIPLDPIKALKRIINNNIINIDYIEVADKRCLNVCGTGLDVDVLTRTEGKSGKLTYYKNLLYCIFHFDPYKISFETDGVKKDFACIMIGVCNGNQFGGGMKLCPDAKPDDGLLDIVIFEMPANGKLLGLLTKFKKGKHMNLPVTTHFKCEKIHITTEKKYPVQLDGEIYEDLGFDCKVVKGGLRTFG